MFFCLEFFFILPSFFYFSASVCFIFVSASSLVSPGETQNAQACAVVDTPPDSGVEDRGPRFKSSQGAYHKIPYGTVACPTTPSLPECTYNTLLKRATCSFSELRWFQCIRIQNLRSMQVLILIQIQVQGFDDKKFYS